MPGVTFLIPASPTRGFLSQIAAFNLAISRLRWQHWEPSTLVCMGGAPNHDELTAWQRHLDDIAILAVPRSESHHNPFHYSQIDGLFRWAPRDADVLVRVDADVLIVDNIVDLLDFVVEARAVAGVVAHYAFPPPPQTAPRDAWRLAADGLLKRPLNFCHAYTLTGQQVPREQRLTPFYLNDGAVFIPKPLFGNFSERFLWFRPRLMDRLAAPYFAGQIAIALTLADMDARTCALPMRYNFPNDPVATEKFPAELAAVKIFHYLRTDAFDRQAIFSGPDAYRELLTADLTGANHAFQQQVLRLFGPQFPFGDVASRHFPSGRS